MTRKSMVIGGIAAAVLIVGGIAAASTNKGNTATASVPAAPLTVTKTAPPPAPLTTTVTRVVDGDTVETTDTAGTVLTIRIIGIDAPEMGTCEGPPAAEAMAAIALNHTVTLQTGGDGKDLDKYGRSLRYVYLDTATDSGLTLLRQGHAIARYDSGARSRSRSGTGPRHQRRFRRQRRHRRPCRTRSGTGTHPGTRARASASARTGTRRETRSAIRLLRQLQCGARGRGGAALCR